MSNDAVQRPEQSVEIHLRNLELPSAAGDWLLKLWHAIRAIDDWKDGDNDDLDSAHVERMAFLLLFELPANPWFRAYQADLLPLLGNAVLQWAGANKIEERHDETQFHKSYMWRAAYWQIVLHVVYLAHGPDRAIEVAPAVAAMYGETFDQYVEEERQCHSQPLQRH